MATFQTGANLIISHKVETTFNTAPGVVTGATRHRLWPSQGLDYKRASSTSEEIRADMLKMIPRLGSGKAPGQFDGALSVASYDNLFEAAMRSTWVAATAITADGGATYTNFQATANNQLTLTGSGSWITAGVRVGDVVRLTNYSTAANNSINLRVKSLTSTVITFHGTPLTTGSTDTACTLTILKKLSNGATPTRRSFYWDVYNRDIDLSVVFGGVRVVGFDIEGTPNGQAKVRWYLLGASATELASGASPFYTSPTEWTTSELHFNDAVLSLGGSDIAICTAFKLSYMLDADTLDVLGNSGAPADVVDAGAMLTGSMSFAVSDLTNFTRYRSETGLELNVLLTENESEPKDCIGIQVSNLKFTDRTNPITGKAMVETYPWAAGPKETTSGYDSSLLQICTSAA